MYIFSCFSVLLQKSRASDSTHKVGLRTRGFQDGATETDDGQYGDRVLAMLDRDCRAASDEGDIYCRKHKILDGALQFLKYDEDTSLSVFLGSSLIFQSFASISKLSRESADPYDPFVGQLEKRCYFQNHWEQQLFRQYWCKDFQPEGVSSWGSLTSDDAQREVGFYGLGQQYVRKFEAADAEKVNSIVRGISKGKKAGKPSTRKVLSSYPRIVSNPPGQNAYASECSHIQKRLDPEVYTTMDSDVYTKAE